MTYFNAKPCIKDVIKAKGLSYRKIHAMFTRKSINLGPLMNGENIKENTAKKFCDAVINLRKAVTCEKDGHFLIFDKAGKRLKCSGGRCSENLDMNSFLI